MSLLRSVGAAVPDSFSIVNPFLPFVPGTADLVMLSVYILAVMCNAGVNLDAFPELSQAGRDFITQAGTKCYGEMRELQVASGSLVPRFLAGTRGVETER